MALRNHVIEIMRLNTRVSELTSENEQLNYLLVKRDSENEAAYEINAELRAEKNRLSAASIEIAKRNIEMRNYVDSFNEEMTQLRHRAQMSKMEASELRYQGIKDAETIGRLEQDIRAVQKWGAQFLRKSENRYDIIQLLKRKITRLEKKLRTMSDVAFQWEEMCVFWRASAARRRAEIISLTATLKDRDAEIAALKSQLNDEPTRNVVHLDFSEIPDAIGIAPCGNGCSVKRDSTGRIYDAHEITCEESEDYETLL